MLFRAWALSSAAAIICFATAARADEAPALTYSITYTADAVAVGGASAPNAGRVLDNLDIIADADLEKLAGWRGGSVHAYVLNNEGGRPNDPAGTLQGVDNIEVAKSRLRLFELWLQQSFGGDKASVLAGLYNLNSEFYVNDSAGRLLAPPFGIGSELAATGPNGPSIFPSTALGARLNVQLSEGAYLRAAVINAQSGVVGDPDGVDFSFDEGVLEIGEIGWQGPVKLSAGAWRYSQKQEDIRDLDGNGDPAPAAAHGAYVLGEARLFGDDNAPAATAFARVGVSDGRTTPFKGGWQAGVHFERVISSRPDSELTVGVQQGLLNSRYRANLADAGVVSGHAESGVEITYVDKITRRISLQPDLQWVRTVDRTDGTDDRWVAALRVRAELGPQP